MIQNNYFYLFSYIELTLFSQNNTTHLKIKDPRFNPKNFTVDTLIKKVKCIGCPITVSAVMDNLDTTDNYKDVFSCGAPFGFIEEGPNIHGDYTYTPYETTNAVLKTCLIACVNGDCDTTIVFFIPENSSLDDFSINESSSNEYINKSEQISNYISPNGDNINDNWELPPELISTIQKMYIFNSFGTIIWNSENGYNNDFQGYNSNGSKLSEGVYFYEITSRNSSSTIKGFIQIGY